MEINMSLQPIEIIEEILGAYAEDGSAMRCDEIHAYLTALISGPDEIADDADAVIDAVIGDAAIDAAQRAARIKALEARIYSENQTQLFIETPYRNGKLLEELVRICRPSTRLCVASNLSCEDEMIRTKPVKEWGKNAPDLNKKPTVFALYK